MTAALAQVDPDLAAVLPEVPPVPLPFSPAAAESPPPETAPVAPTLVAALLAALGEPDLLAEVPPDVPALLRLLPQADLYVQDEVQIALHPTLTRVWSPKGHGGQRLVRAPGVNQKCYGFGQVDWRDGELCFGFSPRRDADTFCLQLDDAVARSKERGHIAIVLSDNAKTHTPKGSKRVREALVRHGDALRLVYTPPTTPIATRSNGSGGSGGEMSRTTITATTSGTSTPTPKRKWNASKPIPTPFCATSAAFRPNAPPTTRPTTNYAWSPRIADAAWKDLASAPIRQLRDGTFSMRR